MLMQKKFCVCAQKVQRLLSTIICKWASLPIFPFNLTVIRLVYILLIWKKKSNAKSSILSGLIEPLPSSRGYGKKLMKGKLFSPSESGLPPVLEVWKSHFSKLELGASFQNGAHIERTLC